MTDALNLETIILSLAPLNTGKKISRKIRNAKADDKLNVRSNHKIFNWHLEAIDSWTKLSMPEQKSL